MTILKRKLDFKFHIKSLILTAFIISNSTSLFGQSDEGIQWLVGIETRNDFIASTGLAYSWADGSTGTAMYNAIYLTYGYGLGDGSSTISTAYTRNYFIFPLKLEASYTSDKGERDFSIEPAFGFGAPSVFEFLVGYNFKLTNNIENYPSSFNLTVNLNPIGLFSNEQ